MGSEYHIDHISDSSLLSVSRISSHQQVFIVKTRKRLFAVLNYENTTKGKISSVELLYITMSIGVCLAITLLKISIRDIIDFNGAVAGCIFVYFIPAALHLKCLYFSKGKVPIGSHVKEKNEAEKEKYVVMVE